MKHLTDARPDFELESYSAPLPLPRDKQLTCESELVGHTISAMIVSPCGRLSASAVIVTDTNCFLVIEAEANQYGGDDDVYIGIIQRSGYVLSDYLSAADMLHAQLINRHEFDAMRVIEEDKKREKNLLQANQLRRRAEMLETQSKKTV